MQIFWPSAFQLILLTTDLFLLLIISSYQAPSRDKQQRNNYKSHISAKPLAIVTFIKHPHNDEAILVTCGQFFILFVPCDHLYSTWKYNIHKVSHIFSRADDNVIQRLENVSYNSPLCPSKAWFIDRLLGAARPLSLASSVKFQQWKKPVSTVLFLFLSCFAVSEVWSGQGGTIYSPQWLGSKAPEQGTKPKDL